MDTNNYGHEFNDDNIPVCKKCGLNIVKAHIWGDAQWTANPISCTESLVEKKTEEVTPDAPVPSLTIEPQDASGMIVDHEIIPGLVSIIVPIYNKDYSLMHYTGHCLGNIRYFTRDNYEIVLVDNASPISVELSQYPVDKIIVNKTNEGYAKAVNKGIRVSQGEYICIMNNDTLVFDGWSYYMKMILDNNLVDLVMATPMYGEPFARAVEAEEKIKQWTGKNLEETLDNFRDFSCVMAKRSLFDEIGLFDEQFFMYGEDLDFLRRMDKAGKKYASTKLVPIFHIIGATSMGISETPEIMNRSKELLKNKWGF